MRAKASVIAVVMVLTASAFAQSGAETKVERRLSITNAGTAQAVQELANVIQTISAASTYADTEQKTIAVRGTQAEVGIAEWLSHELDAAFVAQPAQSATVREYRVPGVNGDALTGGGGVVRLYIPAHFRTAQAMQEFVNTVRTIVDMQRIFACQSVKAIATRGTAAQTALSEWLLDALDKPAGVQESKSITYTYQEPSWANEQPQQRPAPPAQSAQKAIRVTYLANAGTVAAVQEVVNMARTLADVQRMFPYTPVMAIVSRGTPEQDGLLAWLFDELDQPVAQSGLIVHEYPMIGVSYEPEWARDSIVKVIRLPATAASQDIDATWKTMRAVTQMQRSFPSSARKAIAFRGTASQVAMGEQIIRERNAATPK